MGKPGFMYILQCADDSYYTGSTINLERRLAQHQAGEGARHTARRLPVALVYYEKFSRIALAYYREKQVQRWTRKKKAALIAGDVEELKRLSRGIMINNSKRKKKRYPHRLRKAA